MAHTQAGAHEQQHGLTVRQYLMVGLILTVFTVIELWVSYSGLSNFLVTSLLLVFMALKFAAVGAYFMHLRFENSLMTKFFVGSLILAALVLFALLGLFWGDLQPAAREAAEAAGAAATGH